MSQRVWNALAMVTLVVIAVLSLLNLKNADFYTHDAFHEAQTVWFIVGFIVLFVVSRIELSLIERLSVPLYLATLVVLFLTLFVGKEINNARRWIEIFGVTLQASEIAKVAVVLVTANVLAQRRSNDPLALRHLGRLWLVLCVTSVLILIEPDLGTTLIVVALFFSLVLYEGLKTTSFLKLVGAVALILPLLWHGGVIQEYQKDRVRLWLSTDMQDLKKMDKRLFDKHIQPKQALWAVGSGGLAGRGFRQGAKNRLKYLYAVQTDFVMATFGEENGFIGTALLLSLYLFIILWCWQVSTTARDRFGALVAFGAGAMLAWQTWTNLGMILGLAPVVGITFPLMSYGGSSTVITLFAMGLVLNVASTAVES